MDVVQDFPRTDLDIPVKPKPPLSDHITARGTSFRLWTSRAVGPGFTSLCDSSTIRSRETHPPGCTPAGGGPVHRAKRKRACSSLRHSNPFRRPLARDRECKPQGWFSCWSASLLLLLTPIEILSPHHLCDEGFDVFPGLFRLEDKWDHGVGRELSGYPLTDSHPCPTPPVVDKECVLRIVHKKPAVAKRLFVFFLEELQVCVKTVMSWKRLRQVKADLTVLFLQSGGKLRDQTVCPSPGLLAMPPLDESASRGFQLRWNHARVSSPRFSLPFPHAPLFSTYSFRYFPPTTRIRCRCSAVVGRWSKVEQLVHREGATKISCYTESYETWNPLVCV